MFPTPSVAKRRTTGIQQRRITISGSLRIAILIGILALGCRLAPVAGADADLSRFAPLREISSFSSITVSLHRSETGADDPEAGLTQKGLEAFLRQRAASYFPDIPHREPLVEGDLEKPGSAALLGCRIWIDSSNSPAVFQVRCHVSTRTQPNIIEDGSYGYGPPDKVLDIVRQQMDHILGGFGGVYARLKQGG